MMAETATQSGRPVILSLAGLSKSFGDMRAVKPVTLDIPEGEFLTIVGPSGSGKSTLVRLLAGLEAPTEGRLKLRGEDITSIPANRRPTAMVFQSLALFDHRSVGQNIEFAMKMKGVAPDARKTRALELLRLVRLPESYYDRPVTQCSGGEKQRVALARAFASDPEILFFDEPLSAIDYRLRKTLEVELKELHQRTGRTFVYITHSLEEAMVMSDRIAIMQAGELVQIGTPAEIYGRPANRFVASFMGEVNILAVEGAAFPDIGRPIENPGGAYAVLRPEDLQPGTGDIRAEFKVTQRLLLGSRTHLHLESATGAAFVSEIGGTVEAFAVGTTHEFGFARDSVVWVDT
ncbi:ABC transporter ATP-binding protein [Jannaschia seohaensis]|uniref:Spermidine/putrescine transport system ATP-binding protein n=1 Tax=Jannaschia seohaensis TaxID=475081 RepID=A0A2Y9B6V5_9RHOB|nr:ABC transporter ATP-binding protein [Jannaschia seohaensis]PWJ10061.1 spermidine/putrescine transport system ATP-binding protein [Jannaschia seohaensis]SSA51825.1 spermidine/putrescine transport system ATP-binding protein [Jannaschia seohaensis]